VQLAQHAPGSGMAWFLLQQVLQMNDSSPVFAAVVGLARISEHIGHRLDPLASEQGGQRHSSGDSD
jgi:hypothetical protein